MILKFIGAKGMNRWGLIRRDITKLRFLTSDLLKKLITLFLCEKKRQRNDVRRGRFKTRDFLNRSSKT